MNPGMIRRITLQNYRSIAQCRVDLQPLTFLVGRNGAGKSNFLDAFQFVSDALCLGLDPAVERRNGLDEIIHRSPEKAQSFAMRLDFTLADGREGYYAFRLGKDAYNEPIFKKQTQCILDKPAYSTQVYNVVDPSDDKDRSRLSDKQTKHIQRESKLLGIDSPIAEFLKNNTVYSINISKMREQQKFGIGSRMSSEGSNAVTIFDSLSREWQIEILDFLARIVPEICDIRVKSFGKYRTFEFSQKDGVPDAWFFSSQMSEGTLRALGILLAVFQGNEQGDRRGPFLIGLEEPETALYPAAVRVLLQAIREASARRQILVTSHSPGLLDDWDIDASQIIAVDCIGGSTRLGPIDRASAETMNNHLMTAGELLQQNQLSPDETSELDQPLTDVDLFGNEVLSAGGLTEE